MRRRDFVGWLGGALLTVSGRAAAAQGGAKSYRLAALSSGAPMLANGPQATILLKVLSDHGYKLGQNLTYETRAGEAQLSRLPQLARELVASKADAVVVTGYPAAAAMKATGLPTVVARGAGDPVATGLVASVARPGGNITGISDNAAMLSTKRLGLLKQTLPNLHRVAMLWNKNDLAMTLRFKASADAAKSLGVTVEELGVGEPDDFEDAFAAMNKDQPDAILMVADALTILNRKKVFEYAAAHRLPAIYENDAFVRDGGLMSYGDDAKESFAAAGELVARIFAGEKPADLPFEEPTRYLFAINLKTAKASGFVLPPTVLALADEVIE